MGRSKKDTTKMNQKDMPVFFQEDTTATIKKDNSETFEEDALIDIPKGIPEEWAIIFAQNLKREREYMGATAEEMAEQLKVSVSHYRKMEQGKNSFPSVSVLIKIWMVLRCTRETLFEGIIDWDEYTELIKLKEKYKKIKPKDIKRANAILDAVFGDI